LFAVDLASGGEVGTMSPFLVDGLWWPLRKEALAELSAMVRRISLHIIPLYPRSSPLATTLNLVSHRGERVCVLSACEIRRKTHQREGQLK